MHFAALESRAAPWANEPWAGTVTYLAESSPKVSTDAGCKPGAVRARCAERRHPAFAFSTQDSKRRSESRWLSGRAMLLLRAASAKAADASATAASAACSQCPCSIRRIRDFTKRKVRDGSFSAGCSVRTGKRSVCGDQHVKMTQHQRSCRRFEGAASGAGTMQPPIEDHRSESRHDGTMSGNFSKIRTRGLRNDSECAGGTRERP